MVESLAALFEAAWAARPKDATGLRVSVRGRDRARVILVYQIARVPKESPDHLWRQWGLDLPTIERIGRGTDPGPFAQFDPGGEFHDRLVALAEGVSRAVFFEEVKRAYALVRTRIDAWQVVWGGTDAWAREDQERFESLNPTWHRDL
ncbi:MAG: hypothetical protein KC586_04690 [Myxococcales bacterium]|nr:hypothetical protein [Myxococcales bacterium]